MKKCLLILLLLISPGLALSQAVPDSIIIRSQATGKVPNRIVDSLNSLAAVSRFRDSLTINAWSDSLRGRVQRRFAMPRLDHFADSLRAHGVPEPKIAAGADSLLQQKASLVQEIGSKQATLQGNVSARYAGWSEHVRKKFNLDSAGVKLPTAALPSAQPANLPSIPNAPLPDIPSIPSLGSSDFSSLGVSPELSSIGGSMTIPSAPQLGEMAEVAARTARSDW